MSDYRAYVIGPDGHFASSRSFACDSDEYAVEWAKQLLENRPIELWSGERLVKRLAPIRSESHNKDSHEIHQGRMISKNE